MIYEYRKKKYGGLVGIVRLSENLYIKKSKNKTEDSEIRD